MKCELSLKIWERLKKYNGHVSDTRESPTLIPYPSFEAHQYEAGSVPEIISPFRIRVDRCERLWVLDTGFTDILQNPEQEAPPALLIYDLKNDRLLRKFVIPEDQKTHDSLFANIALEDYSCEDTFAYLGDLGGPGLVVYSWKSRKSWLVKHRFFQPDPQVSIVFFIVFSSLFIFIDLAPPPSPYFLLFFYFFFQFIRARNSTCREFHSNGPTVCSVWASRHLTMDTAWCISIHFPAPWNIRSVPRYWEIPSAPILQVNLSILISYPVYRDLSIFTFLAFRQLQRISCSRISRTQWSE